MKATWPAAARQLVDELARNPGRICLVTRGPNTGAVVEALARELGTTPVPVGAILTSQPRMLAGNSFESVLSDGMMLADLDILFTPELKLDPFRLLRDLSKRTPRIAVWPGRINKGRATYSEPGRPDHYDAALENTIVLRPRPTTFPDETPYTEERIR